MTRDTAQITFNDDGISVTTPDEFHTKVSEINGTILM